MIKKNIETITLPNNLGVINRVEFKEIKSRFNQSTLGYSVGFAYEDGLDYLSVHNRFFTENELFAPALSLSQEQSFSRTEQEAFNKFLDYTSITVLE